MLGEQNKSEKYTLFDSMYIMFKYKWSYVFVLFKCTYKYGQTLQK